MQTEVQPEARLATLSAGTAVSRAAATPVVDRLIDFVDWHELASKLSTRRLLPLLGERILAIADGRAPEFFVAATQRAISETEAQETLLELLSIQLIDSLRAAGIECLALKGPLLGRALYGRPGRRPSADIDLLVASEDLLAAVRVAEQLGYLNLQGQRYDELPLLHFRLHHQQSGLPELELHWRVHWYESRFSREMLLRSVDIGQLGRRATPGDELTSLLLFYARDGFVDLRLACDLATWWDTVGPQIKPGAVDEIVERYPALERALLAAIEVADQTVGIPSRALITSPRRLERRVRLATRLANPDARGTTKRQHADAWFVDWLVTPRGGRRECIRRQLNAPSGAQGGQAPLARRDAFASLVQASRLLRRYGFALFRLAWGQVLRRPITR